MPFDPAKQTLDNVTQMLINVVGDGNIGTSVPPKLNGEFRVPFVKNLRMGPKLDYFGGTQYTLLWDEPDDTANISHYNVYVVGALGDNTSPLLIGSSQFSPGVFRVVTTTASVLAFFVQTQLSNGNCSELSRSPSVTALSSSPTLGITSVASGGTGQSTYTDGQLLIGNSGTTGLNKNTLTAGANVQITNGPGTISISGPTNFSGSAGAANIQATDYMFVCTGGGGYTVTMPFADVAGVGKIICVANCCTAAINVAFQAGDVIMLVAGPVTVAAGTSAKFISNGLSGWYYC